MQNLPHRNLSDAAMNEHHAPQGREDDWSNALPNHEPDEDKHMKIGDMIESKYLKQSDVDGVVPVTIAALKKVNVARDDEDPEYRWTARFQEFPKPMVLNITNLKRLAKALGDDTDDWMGRTVELYVDAEIEFGGNIVGGLRLRGLPKKATRPAPKYDERNPPPVDADGEEAPF
jgi:hypothetical protein